MAGTNASVPTREALETALRAVLTAPGLVRPRYGVVAPVVWDETGCHVLVEVRAAGISQAGDPCFPGGRIEPGETPAMAAARELREELGVAVDPARFLGRLPTIQTPLGRDSEAFVCVLSGEEASRTTLNPSEVSELLRVPMAFLLERPEASEYAVGGHVIWGMTAGGIRHLCAAWRRAGLG